ncbi:MAG: UDP-glucose 6-dehydrogenase [Alphaproteobacteria bacterium]|jgi:UDPglucose 6-dehydrogenase|nr:UDP-glucose 6-dehydrogenase [Alphaproteobacteria bacterium]
MKLHDINIGIVGYGFVGGALHNWLVNNTECKVLISDPPKNINDDLSNCDVIFISIHIPTEMDGTQDLTLLKSIIQNLPNCPIFIRTTVMPGICDSLAKEFNKEIYFMPEFLTERTANEDFASQDLVVCGAIDIMDTIFTKKNKLYMSNMEAEIAKYAHNSFGALKVTYFNAIYDICEKNNLNYNNVRDGILLSKYISPTHTMVPGPDGKLGYGGKCFPKDISAFSHFCDKHILADILNIVMKANSTFRK